ncbi:MAG: alpha/beta fold hydrolase [Anaerolineae bacterium]
MKRELRGIKRSDIQLDFDLYRVNVPMPGVVSDQLSVIDIRPEGVERTIVFVHGYAGCAETWERQINYFAKEYRVVAPDLRGHGQSDAPYTRYAMPELVADLYAISQHLRLPGQFDLVGHSFGGSICVEYASAHPEQINHLVLVATAGEYPVPKVVSLAYRLPTALLRPVWDYRPRWNAELHVMKRMANNNMLQWRGWALMRTLRVPTLVITGERDTYFPRNVIEEVAKVIPGAERVDVGASKHKIQLERHQAVNRAIKRFIQADEPTITWRREPAAEQAELGRPWLKAYGKATPMTVPIPARPLSDFLESAADWSPKRPATLFFGAKLSYARLNERAHQFSHVLHGLGIRPGDRVMLFLPNTPELVIAYYGTLRAGGVVVLPSLHGDPAQIIAQARSTAAEVLVTLQDFGALAQAALAQAGVREVLTVGLPRAMPPSAYGAMLLALGFTGDRPLAVEDAVGRSMAELIQDAPAHGLDLSRSSTDLAVVAFSNGAEGSPRGACLTHSNLVANALQLRHWLHDLQYGRETFVSALPLLHSYGMTAAMNLPIAVGATMLLLPGFDMNELLELIWTHQPTFFPGLPAMFAAISHVPNLRAYGFGSIRTCLSGGAPLPVELLEAFERLTRTRLLESYGLTEACSITHVDPLLGPRKAGSVGVPLPNTDARVVDSSSGAELALGEVGELALRGPQVMTRYWDEQSSSAVLRDGWLYTGDLALMDSDGFFRIVGRQKDVIVRPQGVVYPRDVEEVLYENNKVQEAVVIGSVDSDGAQQIIAYVVPRPGAAPTSEELLSFCQRRLEAHAAPTRIEFRTELPRSSTGKVALQLLEATPSEP